MFTHGLTSVIDGDKMLWEETDFDNFQDESMKLWKRCSNQAQGGKAWTANGESAID